MRAAQVQILTHFALKHRIHHVLSFAKGPRTEILPTAEASVRRSTLHLALTRSFASPARTHATHETKTKTKRSRSPGSGLPPGFPLTSDSKWRLTVPKPILSILSCHLGVVGLVRSCAPRFFEFPTQNAQFGWDSLSFCGF